MAGKKSFDSSVLLPWPSNCAATVDRDAFDPGQFPASIVRKEAHESVTRHGIHILRRPDYDLEFDGDEVNYFRKQTPFVEYTPEYKQFFYTRSELDMFIDEVYRTSVETLGFEVMHLPGEPISTTTTVVFVPDVNIFA